MPCPDCARLAALLDAASRFEVPTKIPELPITVEKAIRPLPDGSVWVRWAVRWVSHRCLSRRGAWTYEPFPSSRTDRWLRAHRWDTLDEAMAAARKAAEKE